MRKLYKIVYEETKEDNTVLDIIEFWESPDLITAAAKAHNYAYSVEWELKSVAYQVNIIQTLKSPDKENK